MKLGIINSAFGQAGVDTAIGLQHIARIGFDCVDIFTEAMTITPEEKHLVLDTCRKNNLPIVSLPVVLLSTLLHRLAFGLLTNEQSYIFLYILYSLYFLVL